MMETKNGRLFFDGCDVTELPRNMEPLCTSIPRPP